MFEQFCGNSPVVLISSDCSVRRINFERATGYSTKDQSLFLPLIAIDRAIINTIFYKISKDYRGKD